MKSFSVSFARWRSGFRNQFHQTCTKQIANSMFHTKKKENRINIPIRFGSTLNHEKMEQNKNIIFLKIHSTFFYNVHVLIKKGVKYSSVLD